jgi:hypothetical protein
MAIKLPPPPVQESELNQNWKNWFLKVKDILTGISSLSWSLIDFTNSSITDILERKHNDLQDKQGGTTNQYYHLTQAQSTSLSSGFSGTVTLAKITTGGTDGSLTVSNGFVTSYTAPT